MVKTEMNLVNEVDADREGLDEYLLKIQHVQREQMGFITELRGSLQNYVSAAEGSHQIFDASQEDDDSFDDLRD